MERRFVYERPTLFGALLVVCVAVYTVAVSVPVTAAVNHHNHHIRHHRISKRDHLVRDPQQMYEQVLSGLANVTARITVGNRNTHNELRAQRRDADASDGRILELLREIRLGQHHLHHQLSNISQQRCTDESASTSSSPPPPPVGCSALPPAAVRAQPLQRIRATGDDGAETFYANCRTADESGGAPYTVVLHRCEGVVPFRRIWREYRNGFGNVAAEFWLGLERLRQITNSRLHELHFDLLTADDRHFHARYAAFAVGAEAEEYPINVLGAYSGTAGDAFGFHAGQKFSTMDRDHDLWESGSCAMAHGGGGGWWYDDCAQVNLASRYSSDVELGEDRDQFMFWKTLEGATNQLKCVRMMVRPVSDVV